MSSLVSGLKIGQYRILRKLGMGSFGETFYAESLVDKTRFAVKFEKKNPQNKSFLRNEHAVLADLKDCRYVIESYDAEFTADYSYITMECLGPSLTSVQNIFGDLSTKTVLRVAVHMLLAIKELHAHGYLHRDIKPSNFLIVPNRRTVVKMIDFGLSRRFISDDGEFIPGNKGFVGSWKYSSISAMKRNEITQRDDLISWFYSIVDMTRGKLPWSRCSKERSILRIKETVSPQKLCEKCPKQYLPIYFYIMSLEEYEIPDYNLILSFLLEAIDDNAVKWEEKYDWDYLTKKELNSLSSISLTPESGPLTCTPHLPTNIPPAILPDALRQIYQKYLDQAAEASPKPVCNIF